MPATTPCVPACSSTVQNTAIPGVQGDDGSDGNDGVNAFTVTTADFVVPAAGSNVTVPVESSQWMVEGQHVMVEGPATFTVYGLPNATSVELTFVGASGDVAPGTNILSGSGVSPAGSPGSITALSVYAAGSSAVLTTTSALLDFGTTDPKLTITSPGTWLLFAKGGLKSGGGGNATVVGEICTLKLRRTNNTAADVTNATASWDNAIVTSTSDSLGTVVLPPVVYTTTNSDDEIEMWGVMSAITNAGAYVIADASIIAIKLA